MGSLEAGLQGGGFGAAVCQEKGRSDLGWGLIQLCKFFGGTANFVY
jgi:hypothetical protein